MLAFAANSVLNRMAVGLGHADPGSFAILRVLAGAAMLSVLVLAQKRALPVWSKRRVIGAGALTAYMVGFSLAYLTLDAGLGALILFGVVQMGMFGWASATGHPPRRVQLVGAFVALGGLALVVWPGSSGRADLAGAVLMGIAGLGWAAYSLAGRSEPDALAGTAANFLWCLPVTTGAMWAAGPQMSVSLTGAALAVVSGALTSGLGYALWYRLVPDLGAVRAATVQLSVPVIAIIAGIVLLGEPVSVNLLLGTVLVIGGIFLTFRKRT